MMNLFHQMSVDMKTRSVSLSFTLFRWASHCSVIEIFTMPGFSSYLIKPRGSSFTRSEQQLKGFLHLRIVLIRPIIRVDISQYVLLFLLPYKGEEMEFDHHIRIKLFLLEHRLKSSDTYHR